MIPKAAGLINLHLLHSVSQAMKALPTISAGLPHKTSAPFPPPLPKMLTISLPSPGSLSIHPQLLFLKSPTAMPHVLPLLPAVLRPLPPSPCPPSIYVSPFRCAESGVRILVLTGKLCWSGSPHTRVTTQLAAANRMKKASFLHVFSSEKGLILSFSLLYQLLIFTKLLGEEDFWDLYPKGIVRCGWNWLAGSRSLGSGLTDRLVARLHYLFP